MREEEFSVDEPFTKNYTQEELTHQPFFRIYISYIIHKRQRNHLYIFVHITFSECLLPNLVVQMSLISQTLLLS